MLYCVTYKKPGTRTYRWWVVEVKPSGDVSDDRLQAARQVRKRVRREPLLSDWLEYTITPYTEG